MTDAEQIRRVQLAAQWEIAKGHLRATLAISGSRPVVYDPKTGSPQPSNYDQLKEFIDDFIVEVESQGLAEE